MPFPKFLTQFFTNESDKLISNLVQDNLDNYLDESAYNDFVDTLLGINPRQTKEGAINKLIKSSQKQNTFSGALKHLMIFHKLIHRFGEESSAWILSEGMQQFQSFKSHDLFYKKFVNKAMVPHYYKYLQKLSHNYEDFVICFTSDQQIMLKFTRKDISPLALISKIQNIMSYLIQMFPLFEASIVEFKPYNLIKQIAYYCYTDIYYYYNYVNQVVLALMRNFFDLPTNEITHLYQIYSEHIILTRKLEKYYHIKEKLTEFPLKTPLFFSIDFEQNRRVELHIGNLKKNQDRRLSKGKTLPIQLENMNNLEEDNDNDESVKDVSSVVLDVIAQQPTENIERKSIFEHPMVVDTKKLKKKSSLVLPLGKLVKSKKGKTIDVVQTMPNMTLQKRKIGAKGDNKDSLNNTCANIPGMTSGYPLTMGNESFYGNDSIIENGPRA